MVLDLIQSISENVSRLIVVSANAKGRDLRSIVNEIEDKVNNKSKFLLVILFSMQVNLKQKNEQLKIF